MNMVSYTYDGSFYGLLTVIYEIYYSHSLPLDISIEGLISHMQGSFLNTSIHLETDMVKAEKVNEAILHKISAVALENVYHAYLSSVKGKELIIYNYVKLGFKLGKAVESHLYAEEVASLQKILKKVHRELAYIVGFIRFIQVNNFYYAKYEPDHNITELIAPHFAARFADQYFILHDIRRNMAAIYDTKEWVLTSFSQAELKNLENLEEDNTTCYETLWKEYFVNVAIKERTNERQQRLYMPIRYRKHMLETK